jgi:arylformamidase
MLDGTPYKLPVEVDLQFDLANHQWERAAYTEFVVTKSRKCREMLECIEDIRVGARDEERIDVFPAKEPNSPIVMFIHGGWWRGTTRKEWSYMAYGFHQLGYAVVISDYTLCPKVTIPDITQASRAAVAWAYEHAETINGNRDRLFVCGHSAGGQQAGMIAVTDWTKYGLPADAVKGVVPMSGVFDMRVMQSGFLQPYIQLTGDTARTESALFNIPDVAPPIMVFLGDEESIEFHRQAEVFAEAWRAKGHRAEFMAMENEDHSSSIFAAGDPDSPACKAMVEFFESC